MKRIPLILFLVLMCATKTLFAQEAPKGWTAQPFDHKVFIQNLGQFDKLFSQQLYVQYGAQIGDNLFVYFTTKGILFRTVDFPKMTEDERESPANASIVNKPIIHFVYAQWENSNPNVIVDGDQMQPDYYTYPMDNGMTQQVSIYKKITYNNLYPGIDAVFTFPKDSTGFEYSLIVHPGADLSQVKLKYSASASTHKDIIGNVVIQSPIGQIIDHAPKTYYQNGGTVASSYNLNGTEESFNVPSYDRTKTLVVDPWTWTSSPVLATNKAYDLDYDNQGNIYVYGSMSTWQLAKFNSAGTKLWTYNATPISTGYYGDFCCDRLSGKLFCTEGFNSSGMEVVEVSTAGVQLGTARAIPNLQEGWRCMWNTCTNEIVIAGGGWHETCDAGGWVDTNLNITPVNVLNETPTEEGHDMALTCLDPNGTQCYMASTQSAGDPGNFNNVMIQLPFPAMFPATYYQPTGYTFAESNVAQYVAASTANGMNGMAASPNWLYIYDGAKLKRVNKGTGAIVATVNVTATSEQWSGLDVDNCDDIFVGENSSIQQYNSALSLVSTTAASSTVYDVVLGANYAKLYACGNGFLSVMPISPTCTPRMPCTPLPIELQSFTCQSQSAGIELNWTTSSETNNKFFTIERSMDGINFQPLANINGAGNSSTAHNYSYLDKPPSNATYYYRLSQTDFDGHSQSFNVTSCNEMGPADIGKIYPNPNPGKFTVTIDNTVTDIQIYNALGQKVYDKNLAQNTEISLNVDLSSQAPGIYIMNLVTISGQSIVKKLQMLP